ncbi:atp3 gamma subunit of the F1 sector of mitochondrial F1F0 ATP synthase [Malassezia vespertilionis]|uniref:ATP synthase subunit gamma n=1 Tax=Malassezia vespertilionis TaxID=2020962 RepID=A0A2N1J6W8_9BASI|nr:atp3 gamma subunit of the F1 sector of mitochondrial F1F0 ATP synthase [Malassezia vespertilionis]PKI82306.1 Atp3p [Malassezia vespertilionis]WFD07937.1 atp3 gamma subunit of the F1 sector of mitochondrial F1F0 ATP synthase [Malassezia vespertilionis]
MIARVVSRPFAATASTTFGARSSAVSVAGFHSSGAAQASLRELEQRVKSVKNIEKITKSMKMIAATKLGRAQRAMDAAIAYGKASNEIFVQSDAQDSPDAEKKGHEMFIVMSSDKGLCGGIHSALSKKTRQVVGAIKKEGGESPYVVTVGEKGKSQLSRALPMEMALSFNQIGKDIPTYEDALAITDTILKSELPVDKVNIIYNKYVSSISFESVVLPVYTEGALLNAPKISQYEMDESNAKDLAEFSFTNTVFATLVEGHASEINSKRNAMDNASKNAGEMITNLNLLYNRGRQAAITNELIDIITGASSM